MTHPMTHVGHLLLLLLALLGLVAACDGSSGEGSTDTTDPSDGAEASTNDAVHDAAVDQDGPDAAPDVVPEAADDAIGPDTTPDVAPDVAPDTVPDVASPDGRAANVFPVDPVTSDWVTSVVYAPHLTDPAGRLTGAYANVYNCLPKSSGSGGYGGEFCTPEQTVLPGVDDTYLHIEAPASDKAFDDAFAEVQMYVHINEIHDYFAGTFGFTGLDTPLIGIVNLSMKQYGQWAPFDNAAFMPQATMQAYGLDLGLDGDAIVFGQGTFVDFSYDATVIYHEYTHAVVGEQRLYGFTADVYGLNPEPMAINEATADYFAASRVGNPRIGAYALDMPFMGDLSRNLSEMHTCPEGLIGESHHDGRMWSSGLWAIRVALGQEVADRLIFGALMEFGQETTFHEAADLLLDQAEAEGPSAKTAVLAALSDRNLVACQRVKPFVNLSSVPYDEPLSVKGTMTSMVNEFQTSKIVPMAFQYVAAVPEGTAAIQLDFNARVSDEMSQYWQGPIEPKVAFRQGQAVAYAYAGGKMQMAADALLVPDAEGGNKWRVTLAGSCVKAGELYLQFLNETMVDLQLDAMSLTWLPDAAGFAPNFDGCE
jgi:hypothetical protein